jgi:diacylglycerol kinase family enzyme
VVTDEGRSLVPLDQSNGVGSNTLWGAVVASWGLHAALVADSDTAEYRKFGVDRFKMAANELLYPSDGTPSHRFQGKITMSTTDSPDEAYQLEELEHMYALATLVPRLEKEFLISPDSEPLSGQMKFIRFGPMSPEDGMQLMSLAYQGGKHVREPTVTYADVEVLRIDFQEEEDRWRRVCIDGKIVVVPKDGWIELHKEPRRLLNLIR